MSEQQINELAREWEAKRALVEDKVRAALAGEGTLDDALAATREAGNLEVELRCAQVRYAVEGALKEKGAGGAIEEV